MSKLICLFLFVISFSSFASVGSNEDPKRFNKTLELVSCLNDKQNLNLYSEVKKRFDTFKFTLNIARTLSVLDNNGPISKHCIDETRGVLIKSLAKMNLLEDFNEISLKLKNMYKNIDLVSLASKTFLCKSNKRLERLLGPDILASKKRTFVWLKGRIEGIDGIFYQDLPSIDNSLHKDKILWSFIKELLHNHIDLSREFYARDGDLQISIQLLKDHMNNEMSEKDFKLKNIALGFPH